MKRSISLILLLVFCSAASAQQWQPAASLSTTKRFVVFTVLNTNKVLATGGINDVTVPQPACELWDPATAQWTLTDPMKVARILNSVTKLQDGRIAVFGGQVSGAYDGGWPVQTTKVELFDPATESWSDGGDLQVARQHQTSSLLADGRVLIAGGLTGASPVSSAEIYDPITKTSALVAPMLQARYEHQAIALMDGRVMVTGGRIGGWDGEYLSESEIYDPVQNTWTAVDPMNQSRMRALLVQFSDGSVLSAAGRNTPTSTAPGSELFDLSTGHWTSTDPMKQPCTWLACALLPDNRYLATGGTVDATWTNSTDAVCTPTCEWYDKPNKRWYYAPTMNTPRAQHGVAYVHQDVNANLPSDLVIIGGGITGNNTFTSSCEILDVTESSLLAYKALPVNTSLSNVSEQSNIGAFAVRYDNEGVPHLRISIVGTVPAKVDLINSAGTTVHSYAIEGGTPCTYDLSISTVATPPGLYLARLSSRGSNKTLKVLLP